ncbi:hypothetical protein JAAARDRAFT_348656 [Jaapia argillacea MUCL 33604]|uniref:C3H1-type domain-containing protein n=1 Tax=Jaapia argillacea MUCL 33604 TaxID=933084 RepID=A0A067PIY4_9AGAM|nr:hypothetical protein JAAARDRAFT_348656 [Jaapia argillacea MUCL 33604]
MPEVVTTSSTVNGFFSPTPQEILSPLANHPKTSLALDWTQTRDFLNSQDRRQLSRDALSTQTHQPSSTSFRTPTFSYMHTRGSPSDKSDVPTTPSDRTAVGATNNRWRFNNVGQLVDSELAPGEWDLADEIVRLRIGTDVGGDSNDDVGGQMRTPPQSKMSAVSLAQLHEASPLDTNSDVSGDSSSPHPLDQPLTTGSHSRGSSTDTTGSLAQTLHVPAMAPPKVGTVGEHKERPHSYSGGLSSADLRRLQQAGDSPVSRGPPGDAVGQQWPANPTRAGAAEQPTYPSLVNYPSITPRSHPQQQQQSAQVLSSQQEDAEADYGLQRYFNPLPPQNVTPTATSPSHPMAQSFNNRPNSVQAGMPFRQPQRSFNPPPMQGLLPSPSNFGYPGPQGPHGPHLSLGNAQQMYEMMLHGIPLESHPAVARVQQQHGVIRPTHQHSASDPGATLRDPTTLALLASNMQAFTGGAPPGPGMYGPAMGGPPALSLYANQFYAPQDMYGPSGQDLAAQALVAARLQAQYTGHYPGVGVPQQSLPVGAPAGLNMADPMSPDTTGSSNGPNGNGPSANNRKLGLYKTELCRSWEEKGTCRYGAKCQFAHGEDEIRKVPRHPKYKTEICRTFWVSGSCPYGKRCCFIHTELPAGGHPPGSEPPPPSHTDGRARSMSTNSDPNDASTSLLARISAKRTQESTPIDGNQQSTVMPMNGRPPTGSLRVDTSSLGAPVPKENKSAYPTFPNNGTLLPAPAQPSAMSPGPLTAGPDFGRSNPMVGQNQVRFHTTHHSSESIHSALQQRLSKNTSNTNPNLRHSFNGTEVNLNLSTPPPGSGHTSPFAMPPPENSLNVAPSAGRINGHVRSGSAGNWSSLSRSSHLGAPSPYSATPGDLKASSPWGAPELMVGGGSRLTEQTWM